MGTPYPRGYVEDVLACEIENGFGSKSKGIAETLRYTVGSIVAAAKHVLTVRVEDGFNVAVSPTSGFHHAGYDFSGGFCTFNGLMAAAIHIHALGLAKRVLILDMDQHYGNGTDDIIKRKGITYIDHITACRSYDTASEAMSACDLFGSTQMISGAYDLVIYQAGADIHVDDPLGGLLTIKQMFIRDQRVFLGCKTHRVPLVWNLAGGYKRDAKGTIEPVLALHRQTMLACVAELLQKP